MDYDRAILIVDDEAIILMALRQELRAALGPGFRYEAAMNTAEALAVFDKLAELGVRIVLVITDWLMPGMRGDEFLMRVRASHPEVKTVMVSGQTDVDKLQALKDSGALDVFMKKPWDGKRLIAECRRLLGEA